MPMLTMLRIGLPVCPFHSPERIRSAKAAHPAEHLVHVRHHVGAVGLDDRAGRCPQRDVQHRAVLGDVDVLAAEHRRRAGRPARTPRARSTSRPMVSAVTRCLE